MISLARPPMRPPTTPSAPWSATVRRSRFPTATVRPRRSLPGTTPSPSSSWTTPSTPPGPTPTPTPWSTWTTPKCAIPKARAPAATVRPPAALPDDGDPGNPYAVLEDSDNPYAVLENPDNPYAVLENPNAAGPQAGGGMPLPYKVMDAKFRLADMWKEEATAIFKYARQVEKTDPERADALRDMASRLAMAMKEVQSAKDPRPILEGAAARLEEFGYADEAQRLRDALTEYDDYLTRMRALGTDGTLPPGVLDYYNPLAAPDQDIYNRLASDWNAYSRLGDGDGAGVQNFVDDEVSSGIYDEIPESGVGSAAGGGTPQAVAQVDVPGFRSPDPDIDDSRHLVAIEPEQAVAGGEDAAGVVRQQTDPGTGAAGDTPGGSPADPAPGSGGTGEVQAREAFPEPRIDDEHGARWESATESRIVDPDTGEARLEGDYAEVTGTRGSDTVQEGSGAGAARSNPPDTQAVVDAMPDADPRQVDDAGAGTTETDWRDFHRRADPDVEHHSVEWLTMDEQLGKVYMQHRRTSNWRAAVAYGGAISEMRTELVTALVDVGGYSEDAANGMTDARSAYEALASVAVEAGEAEDWETVARVGEFLTNFDTKTQDKIAGLASRADEFTMSAEGYRNSMDPADRAELAGRLQRLEDSANDRVLDSYHAGDSQATEAANHERRFWQKAGMALEDGRNPYLETADRIAYLRSIGDHDQAKTYEKYYATFTELLAESPGADVLDDSPASYLTAVSNRHGYTRGAIDDIDMRAFLSSEVDESGGAATHGDGAAQATVGDYEAGRDAINGQVGDADYVRAPEEEPAWIASPKLQTQDAGADTSLRSSDVRDAVERRADEIWGAMPRVEERTFSQRQTRPKGMRRWTSPTLQARKGASFGDARAVTELVGSADEASDAGRGSRHVSTPDGWAPTRQPGFRRTASAPGEFPFSTREKLINALMQGGTVDADSLAELNTQLVSARTHQYASRPGGDWRKMAMLMRDLKMTSPGDVQQAVAFASTIDAKSLRKLLDLFDAASILP